MQHEGHGHGCSCALRDDFTDASQAVLDAGPSWKPRMALVSRYSSRPSSVLAAVPRSVVSAKRGLRVPGRMVDVHLPGSNPRRDAATAAATSLALPSAISATGSSVDGWTTELRACVSGMTHSPPTNMRSRRPALLRCSMIEEFTESAFRKRGHGCLVMQWGASWG